jgi:phosphatidylglycerophosphate synthase
MGSGNAPLANYWSLRHAAGGPLITRLVSQRLGALIAWGAGRANLTPTSVTLLGTAVFALAAIFYAALPANLNSMIGCLVLLQLGYGLDCADGQLARATEQASPFGAWLDVACDYLRNVALSAATAYWMLQAGILPAVALSAPLLFLAGAALQLHTVTVLRRDTPTTRMHVTGMRQHVRELITLVGDTAVVLLLLALLRPLPSLLALYLAAIGLLYLFMAGYQAWKRLPGPARAFSSQEDTPPQ